MLVEEKGLREEEEVSNGQEVRPAVVFGRDV